MICEFGNMVIYLLYISKCKYKSDFIKYFVIFIFIFSIVEIVVCKYVFNLFM